ncbi:hypothetical protein KW805_04960 [Candidatus Pacearchaeota archaeon]|nr:hypothetical protein [Candidatus Pacearchaeota archaeon]
MVRYDLFIINNKSGVHSQRAEIDDKKGELPRVGDSYTINSPADHATYTVKHVNHPTRLVSVDPDGKRLNLIPEVPEVTIERLILSDI